MTMRTYRSKLTLLLGASLLALAALLAAAFGRVHYQSRKEAEQQKLVAVATAAAALIDVEAHERLKAREDMETPTYKSLARRFDKLLATTPGLRRVHSLRPEGGKADASVWRYVLDASPAGMRHSGAEPDFSALGSPSVTLAKQAKRAFTARKPVVDWQLTTGENGSTLAAYAPLVDKAGKAVGIVGVVMGAEALQAASTHVWLVALALLAGAMLVAGALAAVIARHTTQPVEELRAAAERVAAGDLARPILMPRDDEFKAAFDTFNGMMQGVRRALELVRHEADRRSRLELAATAQGQLLGGRQIDHPSLRIFQHTRTVDSTGGDWAHYRLCEGRWLYMLCGDIAGHGAPSAMVSAAVAGCFEGIVLDIAAGAKTPAVGSFGSTLARRGAVFGVSELMHRLHEVVLAVGHGKFPMTMLALVLDLETGLAEYVCAGHPPGRIVRPGSTRSGLPTPGNAVGLLRGRSSLIGIDGELSLDIRTERLAPGDAIVIFSDGLLKRRDTHGRPYGTRRIDRVLREHASAEADAIGQALLGDVSSFAADSEPRDDVALMVAQYVGPADDETLEALEEKRKHAA